MSSNLPPGVTTSMIPGNGPEPPCVLCGRSIDDCECPECPECGEVGCVEHLSICDLARRLEVAEHQASSLSVELDRRQMEAAVECPKCHARLPVDLLGGSPAWCDDCQELVTDLLEFMP